jgi:hypothetical protein
MASRFGRRSLGGEEMSIAMRDGMNIHSHSRDRQEESSDGGWKGAIGPGSLGGA